MTLKTKFSIFAFIMFLSLISMGFASWTISHTVSEPQMTSYSITSEEAINSSKYVTKLDSINFTYFPNGFTSSEGEIIDSGTLTIKFNVSSQCLKFKFKLGFNELINKDIDNTVFDSISYKVTNEDGSDILLQGNDTEFEFDLSSLSNNIIVISFTFVQNKEDFYNKVYEPILKGNENIFSYNITVTDIEEVEK